MRAPTFSLITSTRRASGPHLDWLLSQRSADIEVIIIENAGRCGLGQAYNEGLQRAAGQYCVFLHDDVKVTSDRWLWRLQHTIDVDGVDLVGIAGTTCLPLNAGWWQGPTGTSRGLVHHRLPTGALRSDLFGLPDDIEHNLSPVVSLDGVLLCGRKTHFLDEPFDEELFTGFHFYDSDLSLRWLLWRGRQLAVTHAIEIEHRQGARLDGWQEGLNRFHGRHGGSLPLQLADLLTCRANWSALRKHAPATAAALAAARRPGRRLGFDRVNDRTFVTRFDAEPTVIRDPEHLPRLRTDRIVVLGAGAGTTVDRLLRESTCRLLVVEPEGHLIVTLLTQFDWSSAIAAGRLQWLVPAIDHPHARELALQEIVARFQSDNLDDADWIVTGSHALNADFFIPLNKSTTIDRQIERRALHWPRRLEHPPAQITVVSPSCQIFDDLAETLSHLGVRSSRITIPDRADAWSRHEWLTSLRSLMEAPTPITLFRNRVMLETFDARWRWCPERLVAGRLVSWWWDAPNVASQIDMQCRSDRPVEHIAFARDLQRLLPAGSQWLPPAARSAFAATLPQWDAPCGPIVMVGQSRFEAITAHLNTLANLLHYYAGRTGELLARELQVAPGWRATHRALARLNDAVRHSIGLIDRWQPRLAYYLRYLWGMSISACRRLAVAEQLRSLPLVVYGDDGWVKSGAITAAQYRGLALPTELPTIYQSAGLVVNVDFLQASSTVNPRVLDAVAAGAAVLTNATAEMDHFFPDAQPMIFEDIEQASDLASNWLQQPDVDRRQKLRTHVLQHHAMPTRAVELCQLLGVEIAPQAQPEKKRPTIAAKMNATAWELLTAELTAAG